MLVYISGFDFLGSEDLPQLLFLYGFLTVDDFVILIGGKTVVAIEEPTSILFILEGSNVNINLVVHVLIIINAK